MQRTLDKENTTPQLIRVADFANQSGMSKDQVKMMILQGRIKARKLNGKRNSPWMIPVRELTRVVEEVAA